MNPLNYAYLVAYILIYFGVVGGIWVWRVQRRNERTPVVDKLLRTAGESNRRKLSAFDDLLLLHLTGTALIPLLLMVVGLWIISGVSGPYQTLGLIILLVLLAVGLYFAAQWLIKILDQRYEYRIGYFGEREVGEIVDALRLKGFQVFHNVPASEVQPIFHLDHVVVGATGVFAIQTKSRTRGTPRPGFAEHKIIFDGQKLVYPWGDDFQGLELARDRAVWLESWLAQILGRQVPVQPILVFPGWWVEEHAINTVRVLNPKQIPAVVNRNTPMLTEEQVETVTRQLEARCRDVDF
ncbi:MAG: NERD domain-containing protein [Verrucomicrobia bacterium]|nr:NERD domain-containing protein [Verrucomicrobiota bacterium]